VLVALLQQQAQVFPLELVGQELRGAQQQEQKLFVQFFSGALTQHQRGQNQQNCPDHPN
jgi:hypothetical protein